MTCTVACESGADASTDQKLARALAAIGGMASVVEPGARVLIKPNFVAPLAGATTSFELLGAIVREVREAGGTPIIADSSGFEFSTEATLRAIGAYEFASNLGVELLNLDRCPYTRVRVGRGPRWHFLVSRPVLEADRIINVPRLKGHSLTHLTASMKNLVGCVARGTRRTIHATGLSRGIVEINRIIRSDLCIVDGLTYMTHAAFGTESPMGVILAGRNAVATDVACCRILNVDHRRVKHIRLGVQELAPDADPEIVGQPPRVQMAELRSGLVPALHRAGIQGLYAADSLCWALFKGSIIPPFHYYAGLRPRIDKKRCDGCGECQKVCPVAAIDANSRSINAARCMHVRCLRCVEACPGNAIRVVGLRKFAQGNKNGRSEALYEDVPPPVEQQAKDA